MPTALRSFLLLLAAAVTTGAYLLIIKHPTPTGTQRVAILLIDDDFVAGTQSRDDLEYQLTDLTNPTSFASMLKRASNGHFDFQGDVFPPAGQGRDWYTYHGPEGFLSGYYREAAELADDDIDFKQYDRVMVLVPHTTGHAGGPGLMTLFTDEGDIRMPCSMSANGNLVHAWPASSGASHDTFLMGHEFGHTLVKDSTNPSKIQIAHQMTLQGLDGVLYAPTPDAFESHYGGLGFMYANQTHPDAMVKDELGWIDENDLVEIRGDGVYSVPLTAVDATKVLGGPTGPTVQGVKVVRAVCDTPDLDNVCGDGLVGWYYLEYRKSPPNGPPQVFLAIDAWRRTHAAHENDTAGSSLLDMDPSTWIATGLVAGESYVCPVYGTRFDVLPGPLGGNSVVVRIEASGLPPAAQCVADISGPNGEGLPDGVVDQFDLNTIAEHFGPCTAGPACLGDITGPLGVPDGVVDLRDALLVTQSMGTICGE